ncbi:MAG: hypothetical protein C0498_06940 [Anaerolinea sp.]|nr:hypothetical protein [Anaerolinea sp.]
MTTPPDSHATQPGEHLRDPAPSRGLGDSTRAIRAASRSPEILQRPTAVPIFQSATFTSPDAESLAAMVADGRAGCSYSQLSNPTTTALGAAYAELAEGRRRARRRPVDRPRCGHAGQRLNARD